MYGPSDTWRRLAAASSPLGGELDDFSDLFEIRHWVDGQAVQFGALSVLPRLVTEFVKQDAASAGLIYTLFNTVFALLQFLFSPLIGALRAQDTELTRQIADLTSKYGPRHPKILDLEAQKESLDAKIAQEVPTNLRLVGPRGLFRAF